jgi:hypothetical protein
MDLVRSPALITACADKKGLAKLIVMVDPEPACLR